MVNAAARLAGAVALALLLAAAVAPPAHASHDAPTNIVLNSYPFGHSLGWTAPADGAQDGYKIHLKLAKDSWCDPTDSTCETEETTALSTATSVFLAVATFTEGNKYTIRVGATKSGEDPAWSAEIEYRSPWVCSQYSDKAITETILGTPTNRALLAKDCAYLLNEIKPVIDPDGLLNWADDLAMYDATLPSWHGITAGNTVGLDHPRVLHIDLRGGVCAARTCETDETPTKLTGTVPAEFGGTTGSDGDNAALAKLSTIDLGRNALTGSIPAALGGDNSGQDRLDDLNWLLLDDNNLTGTIPGELAHLKNLSLLWLSHNQLTGEIPAKLGESPDWLVSFYFHNNRLTGEIPAGRDAQGNPTGLAKLKAQIIEFSFSNNNFSGEIPIELVRLSGIRELYLSGNPRLKGNLSEDIDITENGQTVTTSLGKELGKLTILEVLDLSSIDLSGEIPAELAGLGSGVHHALDIEVFLNCNKLTGTAPVQLANIKGLTNPSDSSEFAELTKLGLNGNHGLTIPAALQAQAAAQLAAGELTCATPPPPSSPRGKDPARPRARLTASLSATPDPAPVGESVTYTLTVTNAGTGALSGVSWRSPELDVERRTVGDGALAPGAAAETTFSFGPVTEAHLPGPIIVNVFADSDQTNEAPAALAVAVQPAAPAPTPTPDGTDAATDTATDAASTAASAPPDPHPTVSDLNLAILRAFYSAPDPPDPDLGHNILALQLTLPDGTSVTCDFLGHYLRTGGLARWGYATSEILEERPNTLTQYYQRGAVDCHFRDGQWRIERRLTWDFIGGGVFGAPDLGFEPHLLSDQPGIFPGPWGHRVSNFAIDGTYTGFLDFFYYYGGVPAFGYPKTEARRDDHPDAVLRLAGAETGIIRQYFQAAVFEFHPDDPDDPVKLGLAGDVLRDLLYPNQTHQRFASFRPAPILTSGEGYMAERVIWDEAEPAT